MQDTIKSKISANVLRELGVGATDLKREILGYFDTVLRDIASFHDWSWLENAPITLISTASQEYIAVPSYVEKIRQIMQSGGTAPLNYISPEEYNRRSLAITSVGTPSAWTIKGNRVYLHQTPDSALNFIADATLNADQVNDDETIENGIAQAIPDSFEKAVEWGILQLIDSLEKKGAWGELYDAELIRKLSKDSKRLPVRASIDPVIRNSRIYQGG